MAAREAAVPENPPKDALFGETHVHTTCSPDAFIGGARLTPGDAYRFAKGERVTTDHAEFIGELFSAQVEGAPGYDNAQLVELRGPGISAFRHFTPARRRPETPGST